MKTTILNCGYCRKSFEILTSRLKRGTGTKYCTHKCYALSIKGKPMTQQLKEAIRKSHVGRKNTPETIEKMSESAKERAKRLPLDNERNPGWKGEKVSYDGLHRWVQRKLGRPKRCEFCGFLSDNPHMFDWANKSHKYKRDLTDWLRLCRKCHNAYDNITKKLSLSSKVKV
jgi:hypothetical protein